MSRKRDRGVHPLSTSGWPSLVDNADIYSNYYERIKLLAINGIQWDGIPDTCDVRFLELALFNYGMAVFFWDEIAERYVCLPCTISGDWTVYNIPKYRMAYATNGYNYFLNQNNSVLIYNNYLHTTEVNQAQIFARRMYDIEMAISVNLKGQRFPILIKGTENQRLTLQNLYKQYDGNEPFIFGDSSLDIDTGFKVLNTQSPYVSDKLYELKQYYWTEILSYYGVDNQIQKAQRLVSMEAVSNLGYVEAQRIVRMNARKQACDEIREMFGLDMSVNYMYTYTLQMAMDFKLNAPNPAPSPAPLEVRVDE